MIIRQIVITDFKNYKDQNKINLDTKDQKNIVLIGGFNGAGKTSLTEAIRLCLYGSQLSGNTMSDVKYQSYLNSVHNKESKEKQFGIELTLEITDVNPHQIFTISRSFTKLKNNKYEEKLDLMKEGLRVEMVEENYWDYFVEKIIPPNVSRYFFFDGEEVKNRITGEEASDYLTSAIDDLAGISDLNNLKNDLLAVRKRNIQKTTKKTSLAAIKKLEKEINEIVEKNKSLESNKEKYNNGLDYLQVSKRKLDSELKRASGLQENKRLNLEKQINELKKQLNQINEDISEYCFSTLPFYIASDALTSTIDRAKRENILSVESFSRELIKKESKSIVSQLKNEVSAKEIHTVIDAIIGRLSSSDGVMDPPILDLSITQIKQLECLQATDDDAMKFMDKFHHREQIELDISKLYDRHSSGEEESIIKVRESLTEITEKIEKINKELKRLDDIIQYNADEIKKKELEIRKEEKHTLLTELDRNIVNNIEMIIEQIDKRMTKSRLKSTNTLTRCVNDIYNALKNKKDMVKMISFTDAMEINIEGFDGALVPINSLSEGEKGILMYSIVYGLHSLSNAKMPLIIDSPLGRMDSKHTTNLITRYYPTAADQAILLSHDREISGEYLKDIEPYLAHKYLIRSEIEPKVIEGYFE